VPDKPLPLAVVDIDGVLADVRHRLHHVQRSPKDWDAFFSAAVDDTVLDEGRAVADRLAEDHELVYLSGRPERCRDDTVTWLEANELPSGRLFLRPEGDRRPARAFKLDRLADLVNTRDVAVFVDDDPAVCEAARKRGFVVFEATWMEQQASLYDAQERDGRT
jgi:uncharacterized HAD superfamily protein